MINIVFEIMLLKANKKGSCDLELNHTHFLLFDNGQASADSVIKLRADIEKCARQITTETQIQGQGETLIPIVMVLVEGGPSSIETICGALQANTPVVVVKVTQTFSHRSNRSFFFFFKKGFWSFC